MRKGLTDIVEIIFENDKCDQQSIVVTVQELLSKSEDDFYEILECTIPCNSSGCNNESQNFCDCGSTFEDYEIKSIRFQKHEVDTNPSYEELVEALRRIHSFAEDIDETLFHHNLSVLGWHMNGDAEPLMNFASGMDVDVISDVEQLLKNIK